mgnify:CR=1 FL=1
MGCANSSTVNSVNAKSSDVPKHPYMVRSCTIPIEDYITTTHIAKHIENENINVKTLKRVNYEKETHNVYSLNTLFKMNDTEYNNYVDHYNQHNVEKLERISRKFTSLYITKLLIMEVIQTNYGKLKLFEKKRKESDLSTVMSDDDSISRPDSLLSADSDNFSPIQSEKIPFLEPLSYYYKMSINEYNEYVNNWNEKHDIKLDLIKKCVYINNDNINENMKIESINKTDDDFTEQISFFRHNNEYIDDLLTSKPK